jgi:hypothetical protein
LPATQPGSPLVREAMLRQSEGSRTICGSATFSTDDRSDRQVRTSQTPG